MVTFTAIILGEVGYGIVIGLAYSIFTVVIRTQYPHIYVLGRLRNTELYQPLGEYQACAEISGIRILRIAAPIYFANVDFVRNRCLELVYNTDKYRALATQKRYRRCSQAQQHARLFVRTPSPLPTTGDDDTPRLDDKQSARRDVALKNGSVAEYGPATAANTTSALRPVRELHKKNSDATANRSHNEIDTEDIECLRQRSSSAGTQQRRSGGNVGGGILVNKSKRLSEHDESKQMVRTNSIQQRPKLSDVGELDQRERRLRPPRLSVVFAGVLIDNDGHHRSETTHFVQQMHSEAVAPHHIILDCSSVSFVDTAGVTMLATCVRECWSKGFTQVFLAHCPSKLLDFLKFIVW